MADNRSAPAIQNIFDQRYGFVLWATPRFRRQSPLRSGEAQPSVVQTEITAPTPTETFAQGTAEGQRAV